MKIPTVHGLIARRILINYTADPDVVDRLIPFPFRTQVYKGKSIVGICLIRLENIRPKGFPSFVGVSSENGAHRIAVEWDENGEVETGVYIPRRDTSLKLNTFVGGRLFPGKHHFSTFSVKEGDGKYKVEFKNRDSTETYIEAGATESFNDASIFGTLENASNFFRQGDMGYSPNGGDFEGLHLKTFDWEVTPLQVDRVKSSFFGNEKLFPSGSVTFDNALLMRNIEHEWKVAGIKSAGNSPYKLP
jgi:hypothetical protein